MSVETSESIFRQQMASYFKRVVDDRDVVIVRRRRGRDVALIAADELSSIMETAYLLRSPANARRLRQSLEASEQGEGTAMTAEELSRSVGL